ncbi:MAG: hypothetical protein KDC87_14410 [Planctomycetes bacterium]|nr:hypothetical protein [Planctomycetota bacterium]MCB9889318.1 hypothetical protein [Planctomycetota bacterium]
MYPSYVLLALVCAASLSAQGSCVQLGAFRSVGQLPANLPSGALQEVSGLEASRMNPGILWAHDDHGNSNEVVAITRSGAVAQVYSLGSINNGDWEDIAIGPGPEKGRDYIYLADIGNNDLAFTFFTLIRFPEPLVPKTPGSTVVITSPELFTFRYPNQTHDAETLLIDPVDGRPYVLTKEKNSSGTAYLYEYPLPLDSVNVKTLRLAAAFSHSAPKFSGGDVSQDGAWVFVRNDSSVYVYSRGVATNSFASAFTNSAWCVFAAANQGNAESLTVAESELGVRIYTTSEAVGAPILESIATLPTGVVALASWWNFGSPLDSPRHGTPTLSAVPVPSLGAALSIQLGSARPSASIAIGFDVTALPDGAVRLGSGWAHVIPTLLLFGGTSLQGQATIALGTVPKDPGLLGFRLHAQGAVDEPSAPDRMALTRGLSLQVGR